MEFLQHSEMLEARIREAENGVAEIQQNMDVREAELFSEFGFNPEELRQALAENLYQELIERREAEFDQEYDKYTNPDLYTKGSFFSMEEGPNCYAFAFKWEKNPVNGNKFLVRPSPGRIAHRADGYDARLRDEILRYRSPEEIKQYLEKEIHSDLGCAGLEMREVDSADYQCQDGEWMVAMVTSRNIGGRPDFHFYRKGENGMWYHKPGTMPPTNLDDSDREIHDPKTCDRGAYETFHGYYVVRPIGQQA